MHRKVCTSSIQIFQVLNHRSEQRAMDTQKRVYLILSAKNERLSPGGGLTEVTFEQGFED